jgi:hypothetical protein
MDKPLPDYLSSFSFLVTIFIIFAILIAILARTRPNSFNKSFGQQILFTGPMLFIFIFLIMEFIYFKQNPYNSFLFNNLFNMFNLSSNTYSYLIIVSILIVGSLTFLILLYLGDVFQTNPSENNVQTIMNFIIIAVFLIVGVFIYKQFQNKDEQTLDSLSVSKELRDALKIRTKYTFIFAIFMISMILLYILNPFDIMSDYMKPAMIFTLFMGMLFTIIIVMYTNYLENPTKDNKSFIDKLLSKDNKIFHILLFLGLLIGAFYTFFYLVGVFNFDETSPTSWITTILNFTVLFVMFGIIYKFFNLGDIINNILEKNAYLSLLVNLFFYIPCLLLYVVYYIFGFLPKDITGKGSKGFYFNFKEFTTTPTKPFEFMMLGLSLLLLGGHLTWTMFAHKYFRRQYLKQGGQVLVNEPVSTDKLTNVTSFQELSGKDTFDYQYALSFWYYLDAFPPSTNSSYNKVVSLLSYGGNPSINYSSNDNTLYITIKDTIPDTDTDTDTDTDENNASQMTPEQIIQYIEESKESNDSVKNKIETVKTLEFGKELDSDGNIIIYKHPNIQLQKWNHVLLNYSGGTLDVFYNGKLVKTAIEVVPYMINDMMTIGTEKGVSGNIANLTYFDKPLDLKSIDTLYVELKDKNNPSIPSMGKDKYNIV